jgi:hypothetical protein
VSVPESRAGRRRPPRRRRRGPLLVAGALAGIAAAFLLGLAVGRAVEEGPRPAGTITQVRTLTPLELPPATRTVTVTSP